MRRAKSLKLNWNPQSGHNRRVASDQKSCRTRCKFHCWSFSKKIRKHRPWPCYWPSSGWGDPRRRCPKRNRHCKGSRARSWWGQKIFTHIFKAFNDWGLWSKTKSYLHMKWAVSPSVLSSLRNFFTAGWSGQTLFVWALCRRLWGSDQGGSHPFLSQLLLKECFPFDFWWVDCGSTYIIYILYTYILNTMQYNTSFLKDTFSLSSSSVHKILGMRLIIWFCSWCYTLWK